jgi:hypothetical protein
MTPRSAKRAKEPKTDTVDMGMDSLISLATLGVLAVKIFPGFFVSIPEGVRSWGSIREKE